MSEKLDEKVKKEKKEKERRVEELLGDAYLRLKEFREALKHFRLSEAKKKLIVLGMACLEDFRFEVEDQPNPDTAVIMVDAFKEAGKKFPGDLKISPTELVDLGNALKEKGRFKQALECLKKAGKTEEIIALAMKCLSFPNQQAHYYEVIFEALSLVGLVNSRSKLLSQVDELLKDGKEEEAQEICELIAELELQEKERKATKPPGLEDIG